MTDLMVSIDLHISSISNSKVFRKEANSEVILNGQSLERCFIPSS